MHKNKTHLFLWLLSAKGKHVRLNNVYDGTTPTANVFPHKSITISINGCHGYQSSHAHPSIKLSAAKARALCKRISSLPTRASRILQEF